MEIKDYAQILHWLLDGKKVQVQDQARKATWCKACPKDVLRWIGMGIAPAPQFFRLAPRTITINGVEIEAPLSAEEAELGVEYFSFNAAGDVHSINYNSSVLSKPILENGMLWRTKKACIAAHKAITAALTGKTEGRAE